MNNEKAKMRLFHGRCFTGENAEMKTTSFRVPVGLLKDIATVCRFHESGSGRMIAKATGETAKPISQNEFIELALVRLLHDITLEDRGGLRLIVKNPQHFKPANEDTRAEIAAVLADVAALKIDERLGFKTGINELINYHFEKLCKENNGKTYEGGELWEKEAAELRENEKEV